ncbi:PKD domain-containing protein [Streptacidiphilus jiangxiensis]|uniref:PKD domain-containing protein n=1 Tax=Streptacidiphilus jiangxiensis TaxID=235985 RepID=A0A1H7IYV6_STRJI|nr:PKD domain-containing protein [Streptacidiphilus jiangxiensis]SEK67152.1 PKD domain-containing protein [Streptacidiphilus jiangxiensis]
MTFRSLAALTVLTVTAGTALVVVPAAAQTATTTTGTLYVSDTSGCTDSSTRTAGQSYCTVQAAADAAQPGQTVVLAPGNHPGAVTLTHSGQPGAPITITGANPNYSYDEGGVSGSAQPAFTLNNVHDIVLTSMGLTSSGTVVAVNGGSDIRLTHDNITDSATASAGDTSAVTFSQPGSDVQVLWSTLRSLYGTGLTIGQGTGGGVLASRNIVLAGGAHGIAVTDTLADLAGNTFVGACADEIQLAGNSANSLIENNILTHPVSAPPCPAGGDGAQISVSAGSTAGTIADYNLVNPASGVTPYLWGGATYGSPAGFDSGTGQGAHDLADDPQLGQGYTPLEGSPAIDSGDYQATGEAALDFYGHQTVDDPLTPNTGNFPGDLDRGAVEVQDPYAFTGVTVDHTSGTFPLTVTAAATVNNPWSDPISSYTWNFGDGTPTVTTTTPTYAHTYTTAAPAGGFTISVTVTSNAVTHTQTATGIQVTDPGPLAPNLLVADTGAAWSRSVHVNTTGSTDPLPITQRTLSFGDSTPVQDITATGTADHTYAAPGYYEITLTETDSDGRTKSISSSVEFGTPSIDRHDLFARDAAGNLWRYQTTGQASAPYQSRVLVSGGWNSYNLMTLPEGYDTSGYGDMYARDTNGVLWYFPGSPKASGPFQTRIRVGGGWNIYNTIAGADATNGLVARDTSGVLWLYPFTGHANAPLGARIRIGSGWNTYTSLVGIGLIGGDNAGDLLARDTTGALWLYQGTGNAKAPFSARVRVGGGWNIYNSIVGARDLNNDGYNDVVARDTTGVLWLYEGTNNPAAPFRTRTRIGGGWNTYNLVFS